MLAAFLVAAAAGAQQNGDCLACHGEKGFTTERKGRTVSLYVSEKAYAASIHGSVQCVDCHADLAGKELPHEATRCAGGLRRPATTPRRSSTRRRSTARR